MRVIIILFLLLVVSGLSAQGESPLVGPVVAAVPAAQDRIILYDIGGGGRRELSFGAGWHNVWGFSPDGCRVLFTLTGNNGLARAYTAQINGREMQPIVQYSDLPDNQWGVWEPQWSPDGAKIAFTLLRDGFEGSEERQFHVGWVDAASAGGAPTFYSVSGREHTPRWSPTGEWLVYASYDQRPAGTDIYSTAVPTPENAPALQPTLLNEADLWVVSADGANKYRLTNFPVGSVTMPRWSPDGELISFVYSPSPNNDTFWMIANVANAIPTQLSFIWSLAMDMTWLPDSSAIIAAARDYRDTDETRLWKIPLVGGTETNSVVYAEALTHADYPRFSPDGNWLILRSAYILSLINMQDNKLTLLDETLPGNTAGVWSPTRFAGEQSCGF